jgi:hypothetical protein
MVFYFQSDFVKIRPNSRTVWAQKMRISSPIIKMQQRFIHCTERVSQTNCHIIYHFNCAPNDFLFPLSYISLTTYI